MDWSELKKEIRGKAENAYAAFSLRLTPTAYPMLGVRIPALRAAVKRVSAAEAEQMLREISFDDFESVMVYGLLLGRLKADCGRLFDYIERFVSAADNWAHIDCVTSSLKQIRTCREQFLQRFSAYARHEGEFHRRFLVVALMDHFFSEPYTGEAIRLLKTVKSGPYYVDMALGWAISELLTKDFERGYALLCSGDFSASVVKKAARKGIESYRVSPSDKQKLYIFTAKGHK